MTLFINLYAILLPSIYLEIIILASFQTFLLIMTRQNGRGMKKKHLIQGFVIYLSQAYVIRL